MKVSNENLEYCSVEKGEKTPKPPEEVSNYHNEIEQYDVDEIILEQYGRRYHPDFDFD